jgi:phosphoglycolate phosphatase
VKPFAGLKSVLEKLSQNDYLIIISSNDDEIISDFLKRNELSDYFTSIFGTEMGISKKIKLEMALKKFKIPKGMTYFITDTIGDLKELKNFGIKTIAVTWGYHDKEKLEKARPNFIVETPDELVELLL